MKGENLKINVRDKLTSVNNQTNNNKNKNE